MTTITSSSAVGIVLTAPAFTNPVVINPGVAISGNPSTSGNGVYASSGTWAVSNFGTIVGTGTNGNGVYLGTGGSVTNQAGGVIASAGNASAIYITGSTGTVSNASAINAGVRLQAGGNVTNLLGGKINSTSATSPYGVGFHAGGTLTNAGQISGLLVGVVANHLGGTVTNQAVGTIAGQYVGVLMGLFDTPSGGVRSVTNQAGGMITGDSGFIAGGGSAAVTNAGTIAGTFAGTIVTHGITLVVGAGVSMSAGGIVTNQSGGNIVGASYGVYIGGGPGTVVNTGTINGSVAAVKLAAGQTNRVIVNPGAVFNGSVDGRNAIGGAAVSTLELAAGATPGAISGLGVQFTGFAQTTIDSGASWTLSGANALASGSSLSNAGTLTLSGASLTDSGAFINNGSIVLNASALTVAGLTGSGSATIAAGGALEVQGAIASSESVTFAGPGGFLHLDHPISAAGGIANFGTGDVIDLAGVSPATVTYAAGHLVFTGGTIALSIGAGDTIQAIAAADGALISAASTVPVPGFAAFDTTTVKALLSAVEPYTGPVAVLQSQYINVTTDSLNVTVTTPNWFLHSGSGTDGLAVSSGTNVLDGGTGSNFLTGGSGTDTFFVDDRAPPTDIWSTVVNFHKGDAATIWGVTPQGFSLNWADGQGAAGYTGLTLHASAIGAKNASLTLAGFSQADITSGRLTVSYGNSAGNTYMYVHANS